MATKTIVDEIADSIKGHFRTFGDGQISESNPIVNATSDGPLLFAAGVDVRGVIVHVLGCLRTGTKRDQKKRAKKR